jgi:hypothetical protein
MIGSPLRGRKNSGLALAKSILQCALEELEDDDVDWMGLVKGMT